MVGELSEMDDEIWKILDKDIKEQGVQISCNGFTLTDEARILARTRGGYTMGQLVHMGFGRDLEGITFDDITGVPYRSLGSRDDADISSEIVKGIRLPTPLVSANMECVTGEEMAIAMAQMGGLGVIHQFGEQKEQVEIVKKVKDEDVLPIIIKGKEYEPALDKDGRYLVSAAVGLKRNRFQRARKLIEAGIDLLVIDIAHGHSDKMIETIKRVKDAFPEIPVVAGNVAAPKGAYELCKAGADAIKVGVGPGASCTTRIVTGFGRPQITSIYDCYLVAREYGAKVMADGGIKNSGDMVKALVAGGDTIMIGGLLAATDNSNLFDQRINKDGTFIKYYGSASEESRENRGKNGYQAPEGRTVWKEYTGSTDIVLGKYIEGMKSGLSYAGMSRDTGKHPTIERIRDKSRWIRQTHAGLYEATKGKHDPNS